MIPLKKQIKKQVYSVNRKMIKNQGKANIPLFTSRIYQSLVKFWFNNLYKRPVVKLEKNKIIYIPVPKAAQSSIRNACNKIERTNLSKKYNPKAYFVFSFVRNPYDRVVSCYEDKINNSKEKEKQGKFNNFLSKYPQLSKEHLSFKGFVKFIHKIPDFQADQHFRSQYLFLTDKKGNLIPGFVGKFENLDEDFKKACKKAGVENPPELPQRNKSKRKKDYRDYYDEETKKLV